MGLKVTILDVFPISKSDWKSIFKNGNDSNGRFTRVCPFLTYRVLDGDCTVAVDGGNAAAATAVGPQQACAAPVARCCTCCCCIPCRVS